MLLALEKAFRMLLAIKGICVCPYQHTNNMCYHLQDTIEQCIGDYRYQTSAFREYTDQHNVNSPTNWQVIGGTFWVLSSEIGHKEGTKNLLVIVSKPL